MELDQDSCYSIIEARDGRFDGRFFSGVVTTGIYCRPICPARTPHRSNVRFYPHAAAAEADGFRPCRRCRPDAAPGTPAWNGTTSTVTRGLRLIAAGALDDQSVADLALRLGLGERQLRRRFQDSLGTGPLAVARTRRAHFARRLIEETSLPMTEVASAAGFGSVRQFNEQLRATFGRVPTELRQRRGGGGPATRSSESGAWLELTLPYRQPFDWPAHLAFLLPRAIPGVEVVLGAVYRRVLEVDGRPALIEVRPGAGATLLLRYRGPLGPSLMHVVERARRFFDLDADPARVAERLGRDRRLAPLLARRPGLRVPGAWEPFELAVRAIIGQQVSVRGATTLTGRLVARHGQPLPRELRRLAGDGLTHLFPRAEKLVAADVATIGMPRARGRTVKALARAVSDGSLPLDPSLDLDASLASLQALPGIGPWTASYIALRALGEPDAFPRGDLGLEHAWAALTGQPSVSGRDLMAAAEAWRPWRAYAALHLWASL